MCLPIRQVASVIVTCDVPVGTEHDVKQNHRCSQSWLANRYEDEFPGLSIFVTGEVPLMETFGRAALADSAFLIPLALAVMIGMVALFFLGVGDSYGLWF